MFGIRTDFFMQEYDKILFKDKMNGSFDNEQALLMDWMGKYKDQKRRK